MQENRCFTCAQVVQEDNGLKGTYVCSNQRCSRVGLLSRVYLSTPATPEPVSEEPSTDAQPQPEPDQAPVDPAPVEQPTEEVAQETIENDTVGA